MTEIESFELMIIFGRFCGLQDAHALAIQLLILFFIHFDAQIGFDSDFSRHPILNDSMWSIYKLYNNFKVFIK